MNDLVTNFVSINAIKYADPIQWNITKSYEKNTVVIDGNSGVAYISVQPVPPGIALTRERFWTKVFDLSIFITKGSANFANNYESEPTTTATIPTAKDKWIVWDGTLYQALTDIHAGDRYVPDGNIRRMTVEDFYDILKSIIDNETSEREAGDDALELALNEEIEVRGEADNALHTEIVQESVDRENADTALQQAIDDETERSTNADTALQQAISDEEQARINADNNIIARIDNIFTEYHFFEEFGAVGDGVTDDTTAFINAMNSQYNTFKLLANKTYLISRTIPIVKSTHISAEEKAKILVANNSYPNMAGGLFESVGVNDIEMDNFEIDGNWTNNMDFGNPDSQGNLPKHYAGRVIALLNFTSGSDIKIHNMYIHNSWTAGIWLSDCPYAHVFDNTFKNIRVVSVAIRNNEEQTTLSAGKAVVNNNTIVSNGVLGIECLFGTAGVSISNNNISNCGDPYKFPSFAFYGTYPNVYPKDNRFNTPSSANYVNPALEGDGACVECTGAYTSFTSPPNIGISVSGNVCDNAMCGIRMEEMSELSTISGNVVTNCREGLFIFSANNVTCSSNGIKKCTNGININYYQDPSYNIVIDGNIIEDNAEVGIAINAHGAVISNNVIADNLTGIYSSLGLVNCVVNGNLFAEIRAGSTRSGIDLANIAVDFCRVTNNNFNLPVPVGGVMPDFGMSMFDNNIRFATRRYGVADIGSSLTTQVSAIFPQPPYNGEIQITPVTPGMDIQISNITTSGFTATSNIPGTFNWCIDFNQNLT